MKRHRVSVVALVLTISICWCGPLASFAGQRPATKSANIVGVWESKSAEGSNSVLLLNADGTGEFNGKELRWTVSQNVLSLSFEGGSTYMYETALAGNSLTVKSADLPQPLRFTRSGSGGAAESGNPLAGGGLAGIAAGGKPAAAGSARTSGPEGTWQVQNPNGTFTLVLEPGGTGSFNNDPVKWEFSRGILTLRSKNGDTLMYNAALTANTLRVTGGNLSAPIEFQRAGGGAPAGMAAGGMRSRPSAGGGSGGPIGQWETSTPNGVISLILNPDGSGTFGQGSVRWSFSRGVLTLTGPNGTPIPYPASIGPDSMTLTDSTSGAALSFRRAGGQSAASGDGFGDGDEGLDGGEDAADASRGFGGNTTGGLGGGSRGGSLTGSWRNQQGSTLQLNPDGSAILNGQRFKYTSDGSTITLIGADGSMPFPYSLSGNTLTVQVQGQTAVYTRTGGAGGQGGRAGGFGGGGGGGSNPPEMFGKWCSFSGTNTGQITSSREQCFTLNPDGTYVYGAESDSVNQFGGANSSSSDSGTWSVEGSTLVGNSRAQGRVVYQLEKKNNKNNDPMLCLDGQCFVTYGQKPPWPY